MKSIASIISIFALLFSPTLTAQDNYSGFAQKVSVAAYAGKNFKYSGAVKSNDNENSMALLTVKVQRKENKEGFSDFMLDRRVKSVDWVSASITGKLDDDADSISLGGIVIGNGSFYFDDLHFSVETSVGNWVPVTLANNGFEKNEPRKAMPDGWHYGNNNGKFSYYTTSISSKEGRQALMIKGAGMEESPQLKSYTELTKFVKENYVKSEHKISMRDGVKLYTIVYTPKDASASNKYPILLNRTCYSIAPYGPDKMGTYIGVDETLIRDKYIIVQQDVRGRYMSEGVWTNMTPHKPNKKSNNDVDESSDTYDAIDWLVKNIPFNNGRVGQTGISYPGFYTTAGSIDAHPALKAVSPQAPIADFFFDDFHHNGAFTQSYFTAFPVFGVAPAKPVETNWFTDLDIKTKDGYDFFRRGGTLKTLGEKYYKDNFFWKEITEHPNYDSFWQKRNILPHLKNLKPAYLFVGGWFDAEDLYGPLASYKQVEKNNPGTYNIITMGPFGHGDWFVENGNHKHHQLYWGDSISTYFQRNIELPFFRHFLKETATGNTGLPEAHMFNTGLKAYEKFSQWPPANAKKKKLYFQKNEGLAFTMPSADGFSQFVSDPRKPVPYTMDISGSAGFTPRNYMSEDQRFAYSRPDVLVFETPELTEDITLGGELLAKLLVSTTGTDADWIVKLIDVYPGDEQNSPYTDKSVSLSGYQHMVRSEIMRSRFRNSFEKPEPMVANKITPINFALQDVLHTFKKGHRIMIQVQSTWFPLFDRNPQKYVPNIYKAEEADFIKATHRVYHNSQAPSYLEVSVLE